LSDSGIILHSFDSNVGRRLSERVNDVYIEKARALIQGGAKRESAESTAAAYGEDVGYARALLDLIDWIKDVEDELTGRKAAREKRLRERPE